jgi:hypothetical protein
MQIARLHAIDAETHIMLGNILQLQISEGRVRGFCVTDSEGRRPHLNFPSRPSHWQLRGKKRCAPIKTPRAETQKLSKSPNLCHALFLQPRLRCPPRLIRPYYGYIVCFERVLTLACNVCISVWGSPCFDSSTGPKILRRAFRALLIEYQALQFARHTSIQCFRDLL